MPVCLSVVMLMGASKFIECLLESPTCASFLPAGCSITTFSLRPCRYTNFLKVKICLRIKMLESHTPF